MSWGTIIMWACRAVIDSERKNRNVGRFLARILVLFASFALAIPNSYSAKKKTVGDLLKNIEKKAKKVELQKKKQSALPQFQKFQAKKTTNLRSVKPPKSSRFYFDENTDESALEKVTDESIDQLYKLTQRFRKSSKRGELWLRLAELYVEKSRLIEYRLQGAYEKQLALFETGKIKRRPRLNLSKAEIYNKKAIQLYEWFLRDFPKDPKIPQALFFLGYNYFEIGKVKKGQAYYLDLTKRFPNSKYVDESHFALGEFHFENEDWKKAAEHYGIVARKKRARLRAFALYKLSWCDFKMGKHKDALRSLERVIYLGRKSHTREAEGFKGVNQIRLANEAVKDLVAFYGEAGSYKNAKSYFTKVVGRRSRNKVLEKLGYYYVMTGNRDGTRYIFTDLIDEDPQSPKAFDYQYQIVSMFGSGATDKIFRKELYKWITDYGPGSLWSKANKDNANLRKKAHKLIETTLRNHVLQLHQTAQNSRAEYSRKEASKGYELYFSVFQNSPRADEMHFFYAELLFDMGKYEAASEHYLWVSDNAPKSKYHDKATLNAILSVEKKLPTAPEIKKIVGDSVEPVEFDRNVKNFEKVALRYFKGNPKGENRDAIKYRLGSLYYYYNHFDKALVLFKEVIKESPKSKYAEYSANLILDIYNLKQDYEGLNREARWLLSIPQLAKSSVGAQVRKIQQRSAFKRAGELEKSKDYLKSAKAYENFGVGHKDAKLAVPAMFNAAINYERGGNALKAAGLYAAVIGSKGSKEAELRKKSQRFLAAIYERVGQYPKAAQAYQMYAKEYPKDKAAINYHFNAAVIFDGLNHYNSALQNYQTYFDKSRSKDRVEIIYFMGRIWERRGNLRRALSYYKQYMDSATTNKARVVEVAFKLAQLNERLRRYSKADEWYRKTVVVQRNLSKGDATLGVRFASEAKFKLVYKTYQELIRIKIPRSQAAQGAAVQKKLNLIERLKKQLKDVVAYDDGHQIVAALALQAQSFQHMAASLFKAPVPKGLSSDELKAYKQGIDKIAQPFEVQAIEHYKSAIAKSRELKAYNNWTRVAHKELTRLKDSEFGDKGFRAEKVEWANTLGL